MPVHEQRGCLGQVGGLRGDVAGFPGGQGAGLHERPESGEAVVQLEGVGDQLKPGPVGDTQGGSEVDHRGLGDLGCTDTCQATPVVVRVGWQDPTERTVERPRRSTRVTRAPASPAGWPAAVAVTGCRSAQCTTPASRFASSRSADRRASTTNVNTERSSSARTSTPGTSPAAAWSRGGCAAGAGWSCRACSKPTIEHRQFRVDNDPESRYPQRKSRECSARTRAWSPAPGPHASGRRTRGHK